MTIAIVEDHVMFREVIRKVCIQELGYHVIVEVDSVCAAIAEIPNKKPDVTILDLALPDGDGFEVMQHVAGTGLQTKFAILSAYCDTYTVYRVGKSSASAFIDKGASCIGMIASALRAIENGLVYFSPAYLDANLLLRMDPHAFFRVLTQRELSVLTYITNGSTDNEIGKALSLSPKTVKTHRGNILRKLKIANTTKLVAFALRNCVVLPRQAPLTRRSFR